MGIIISAKRREVVETVGGKPQMASYPLGITVRFECDEVESIFCRGFAIFEEPDGGGYIEAHKQAMKAGWLERASPGGRLWICPACSGK